MASCESTLPIASLNFLPTNKLPIHSRRDLSAHSIFGSLLSLSRNSSAFISSTLYARRVIIPLVPSATATPRIPVSELISIGLIFLSSASTCISQFFLI